jgi:hypothetical protein
MSKEEENEKYYKLKKRNRAYLKLRNEKHKKEVKGTKKQKTEAQVEWNKLDQIDYEEQEDEHELVEDELVKACRDLKTANSDEILTILYSLSEKISLASDSISSNYKLLLKEMLIILDKFASPEISSIIKIK